MACNTRRRTFRETDVLLSDEVTLWSWMRRLDSVFQGFRTKLAGAQETAGSEREQATLQDEPPPEPVWVELSRSILP